MKTIKIIDLLNKIANGEEVPKKIKCKGYEYWYCNDLKDYQNAQVEYRDYLFASKYHSPNWLDYEVEILDEEDEFDNFSSYTYNVGRVDESNIEEYIHTLFSQQMRLIENQNKIIKKIKELEK